MNVLMIVRRYGPKGGMERYVWEVTREFVQLGHRVVVLCEYCTADRPDNIEVHELGEMTYRPRWLYYWRFGRRVERWLKHNPHPGWLIHSNERTGVHQVTTFHGPPFAAVRDKPWWKRCSLRVAMQLYMERRELSTARIIVPNSEFIRQQLAHYYPEYAHKLAAPIVPGVQQMELRDGRTVAADGGVVGFVGYEWKRKGLPLAVEIVQALRRSRPNLELWVAGSNPEEVRHLFAGWQGGYRLLGWQADMSYMSGFDVLLHPAKAEPYGMVIAEAMAARVPVVVSDVCGAAVQVGEDAGCVLPLDASLEQWVGMVEKQLQRETPPPEYIHGWEQVAKEYETVYRQVGA